MFFTASDFTFTTTKCPFHFGPDLFLVLFLYFSLVAYRTPSDLEGSSSGVISFCLFILSMGFLWQGYWSGSPPLVQWTTFFTVTRPSRVTLHGMAHSFIEFCKSLCHNKTVIHEGVVGTLPGAGAPPMTKVMRKEAWHTQRRDQASGVPLEILEHLPPKPESAYFLLCALTYTSGWGAVPHYLSLKKRVNL